MIREVVKVDYIREKKRMIVHFKDGTEAAYRVDSPAADAMIAAGSLQHHFAKYIEPIYRPLEESANV